MSKPTAIAATLFLILLVPGPAGAGPTEAVKSAADATGRGVEKAKEAVVHVVKAAASGIAYGGNKAGQAINHVVKKAGLQTESTPSPKT